MLSLRTMIPLWELLQTLRICEVSQTIQGSIHNGQHLQDQPLRHALVEHRGHYLYLRYVQCGHRLAPGGERGERSKTLHALKEKLYGSDYACSVVLATHVNELLGSILLPPQNTGVVTQRRGQPVGLNKQAGS